MMPGGCNPSPGAEMSQTARAVTGERLDTGAGMKKNVHKHVMSQVVTSRIKATIRILSNAPTDQISKREGSTRHLRAKGRGRDIPARSAFFHFAKMPWLCY